MILTFQSSLAENKKQTEHYSILDKETYLNTFFSTWWVDKHTNRQGHAAIMTINGSLNDTWNSLYIMENLFKCSYKFQSCPKWENVFFRAGCPSDAGKNYSSGFPKIELIPVYNTLYNRRQNLKSAFLNIFISLKKSSSILVFFVTKKSI